MVEIIDFASEIYPEGKTLSFEDYHWRVAELIDSSSVEGMVGLLSAQSGEYQRLSNTFNSMSHGNREASLEPYARLQQLAANSIHLASGIILCTGASPGDMIERKHLRNLDKYQPL